MATPNFMNATLSPHSSEPSLDLKTTSLLLLCVLFILTSLVNYGYPKNSAIPRVVASWRDTLRSTSQGTLILKGYKIHMKGSNKAFMVNNQTMLPPSLFSEARKLPSNVLNFDIAAEESLLLRFSLGEKHSEHLQLIAHDLARNLNSQIEPLCDELERTFDDIFLPPSSDLEISGSWRAVAFHPTVLRIIGIIVSRAFVGEQLCRDKTFTRTVADFANGVVMQLFILKVVPGEYLKSQLAKILPQRKRVAALREMVREPVLARLENIKRGTVDANDYTVLGKIVDMVVSKYYPETTNFEEEIRENILRISSTRLLALMFGAIDTTTLALCQAVFDLIGHKKMQYADPLREEVQNMFERNCGKWDINAINELKLLDSFVKESQRLHAVAFSLGARKVVKPGGIKFSNGDFIPEGHTISHPLYAVHRDPDNYDNPDTFIGFRFARGQDDQRKTLTGPQISDQFLAFGYGKHVWWNSWLTLVIMVHSPGRAFALVVIKLMMIRFLMKYDFKETERPKDWSWGNGLLPDMKMKVLVKRADGKT